jgi:hypothetical protein
LQREKDHLLFEGTQWATFPWSGRIFAAIHFRHDTIRFHQGKAHAEFSHCLQDFTSKHEACCLAVGQKGPAWHLACRPALFVPSRCKPRAEEEASLRAGREILGDTDSLAVVIGRLVARAQRDQLAVRREGDRADRVRMAFELL